MRVTELDVGANPTEHVDIALFDTYGHARGGVDRVQSLADDARVGRGRRVHVGPSARTARGGARGGRTRGVVEVGARARPWPTRCVAIHGGQIVVSPAFSRPRQPGWPGHTFRADPRESEVAVFLVQGFSNHEIADALWISEHTVKSHLKSIFQKIGVTSRAQAIARISQEPAFRRVNRAGVKSERRALQRSSAGHFCAQAADAMS